MDLSWSSWFFVVFSLAGCLILSIKGSPAPIGFYPLDGLSGLNDTSSCGNSPGITNGTSLAPGYIGEPNTAFKFTGNSSSFVLLPNNGMFNTESITLIAWFNTETVTGQQTILQFSSEGRLAILLALNSDKLNIELYPNCDSSPISLSPPDLTFKKSMWYFIGVSYDTGLVDVLVRKTDGTQFARYFSVGDVELEAYHDIWLGYGPESPGAFNGRIACVQIYSQSMSLNEIMEVQKLCLPTEWSEPFALYALDDQHFVQDMSDNPNPNGTAYSVNEEDGPFLGETSIHFGGESDSYISILHNGELSMNASFSILAWIYKDRLYGYEGHIATFGSDNQAFSGLVYEGGLFSNKYVGKLYFPSSGQTKVINGAYFSTGLWLHVALIYNHDTGYAGIYTNTEVHKEFVGRFAVGTSEEIIVGKSFLGRIACLQFYRRPLRLEHVEDAKDKCYRLSPDPPLCSPPSHVTISSCSGSSSLTSSPLSSLSSISMDSTHLTSLLSAIKSDVIISSTSMSSTFNIDSEPTPTIGSSVVWTTILSESQKKTSVSYTSTIISPTLTLGYSNTGVQTTMTVPSMHVSSVEVSKTGLSDSIKATSLTHASSDLKTTSSLPETSKPTPLVASTSHFTTRAQPESHVLGSGIKTVAPSRPLTETAASYTTIKGNERPTNWTQWTAWSSCSKPCGTGEQSRIRRCNKTEIEDCVGEGTETRQCNNSCEAAVFNVTAILAEQPWNDSLLLKNSSSFIALEEALRQVIKELYTTDSVKVTLLSCRKGSVIAHFSVEFEATDSDQVVKLADGMEIDGHLQELGSIVLVNVTADKVPNQNPATVKTYLTSATSVRVSWAAIEEPIDGYHVAFRSASAGDWTNVYTTVQTLSLDLENLKKGDVYRFRVAAFNTAGNGIPSKATKIHIKEGVPRVAPVVSVSDIKTTSSLMISWTTIPEEHVKGKLLGYHITYKPIKIYDQNVDEAEAKTVTVPASERKEMTLESLSSFTQYSITIAGYTAAGDGKTSEAVLGETCICPKILYTNWALYPPYVTEINQQPAGIIGDLVQEMILSSCGKCEGGHGDTILNITHNGKGDDARKNSMCGVQGDVDDRTHVSFPIIGNMDDEKYLKEFVFVPVVQSPGIAFISLANKRSRAEVAAIVWNKGWPVIVLSVMMGFIFAVFVWMVERQEKTENFPKSFLRGTGDLTWFSFMSMTTVGFGEKVPVRVVSRLLTIFWIMIGLVLISIYLAVLTVALTVMTTENQIILYGTKVAVLRDSPSHRLGILRNARVEPMETLEEAFEALQNKETEGFLLDAYVAGSGVGSFIKTPYRVNKVLETKKGLGLVLSGEAVVLHYRVRDFVRKNARRITEIIQNSTTPIKQPEQSEAEEKAQSLVNATSPTFRDAIAVTAGASGVSFLVGVAWELFRKRRQNNAKEQSMKHYKSQKAEMAAVLEDFNSNFTQAYNRLRDKHKGQLQMYQATQQKECRPESRDTVLVTTKSEKQ